MANMIEKFKENKKVMEIKMEQARKIADEASDEFVNSIKSLVKDSSEEELKAFLKADDDSIDDMDKLIVVTEFAKHHDDIGGIAIIGIRK